MWKQGRFIEIPPPDDDFFPFIQSLGINDRTQVVGSSSRGAFVWERGKTTFLPSLTRASGANDINEDGVIAGHNPTTTDGLLSHAVVWMR